MREFKVRKGIWQGLEARMKGFERDLQATSDASSKDGRRHHKESTGTAPPKIGGYWISGYRNGA